MVPVSVRIKIPCAVAEILSVAISVPQMVRDLGLSLAFNDG
jgi:hypothetical protein